MENTSNTEQVATFLEAVAGLWESVRALAANLDPWAFTPAEAEVAARLLGEMLENLALLEAAAARYQARPAVGASS